MEKTDFLVVGSGLAGLLFALEVAENGYQVLVLNKGPINESNTTYAQGGIASVSSPNDSFDSHIEDTLISGAGLCDPEIVELVVNKGPKCINRLIEIGVKFDQGKDSNYALAKEGGHSQRRVLHFQDTTGAEIQRRLEEKVKAHPNIKIKSHQTVIDFIKTDPNSKQVDGLYALDENTKQINTYSARCFFLAAGGAGKVYLYTSNPDVATGDGMSMAYRAGAGLQNMEFVQFHPTCFYHPQAKTFLITEAMRGEGAVLVNLEGQRFMPKYDNRGELAPRDIVARAIDAEMKATGERHMLLDISFKTPAFIKDHFPNIYETLLTYGCDITEEPIPVVPAAHYFCGGVPTDKHGRTSLHKLYAAGEVTYTGLHGANRLASNSLLEAGVFALEASKHAMENLADYTLTENLPDWNYGLAIESTEEVLVSHYWEEVRRTMWNLVGIVRSDNRLRLAKKRITEIKNEIKDYYWKYLLNRNLIELRNITILADVIIDSALERRENCGLHFNVDNIEENICKKVNN